MPRRRHEPAPDTPIPEELSRSRQKGPQLYEILTNLVESLGPGAMLPSERVLATRYGVARQTVRQEVDRLVKEGVIWRRHGQGTFVAGPRLVQSETLISFSHDMRRRGLRPGGRVVSVTTEPADDQVAHSLKIEAGANVLHLVRVRTADDEPMALERAYLPADRFGGLEKANLDGSLWEELERNWGLRVANSSQRISVVRPDEEEAKLLEIPADQPCFLIEGVTRDEDGAVFEFERSLYRGDRYDVSRNATVSRAAGSPD